MSGPIQVTEIVSDYFDNATDIRPKPEEEVPMSFLDDLKNKAQTFGSSVATSVSDAGVGLINRSLGVNGGTATRSDVGVAAPGYTDQAAQVAQGVVGSKIAGIPILALAAVAVGAWLVIKRKK